MTSLLGKIVQAASGIAHLSTLVLGEPRYLPTIVADKTTAMTVVYAVLAALYHRERTGQRRLVRLGPSPVARVSVHVHDAEPGQRRNHRDH